MSMREPTNIAFPQRQNGSMRAVLGLPQGFALAMMKLSLENMPGIVKMLDFASTRWDIKDPMHGAFTICTEASGNGVKTGMEITLEAQQLTQRDLHWARFAW